MQSTSVDLRGPDVVRWAACKFQHQMARTENEGRRQALGCTRRNPTTRSGELVNYTLGGVQKKRRRRASRLPDFGRRSGRTGNKGSKWSIHLLYTNPAIGSESARAWLEVISIWVQGRNVHQPSGSLRAHIYTDVGTLVSRRSVTLAQFWYQRCGQATFHFPSCIDRVATDYVDFRPMRLQKSGSEAMALGV